MKTFSLLLLLLCIVGKDVVLNADDLTARDIATARKLYVSKCAKCHQFYEPKNYSEKVWLNWMDKMAKKSKLKPDQAKLLVGYLDAYRQGKIGLPIKPAAKFRQAPRAEGTSTRR